MLSTGFPGDCEPDDVCSGCGCWGDCECVEPEPEERTVAEVDEFLRQQGTIKTLLELCVQMSLDGQAKDPASDDWSESIYWLNMIRFK